MLQRWVGRRIDDFEIEDRIGRGGMAIVYRAHQLSVNRYVALKIIDLSPNQEERDEFRKRFAQEAAVIALLEHIHILPIYAYGIVEDEFAYIAMRLLRGGSLADLLRKGPLTPEHAADIFTQVGRGLDYAHRKGVIHRDLKPSNILLDDSGNAYLSDFGLAKMVGSTLDLTRSGNLVGTPAYVAPELVRGESADYRSDIYSLGILLYHMLVGRPPFELSDTGIAALLYKHVEEPPPPPHLFNPSVTPELEIVILRALDKDPNQRYQSAEEMVQELSTALGRKSGSRSFLTLRTPNRLRQLRFTRRRLPRRIGVALLMLIVVLVAAMMLINSPAPPAPFSIHMTPGTPGTLSDMVPNADEVAAAQAQLGDGFVAFLACTYEDVSQVTRAREMSEMFEAMGMNYRVYNAENDAYTQITQIEQARLDGAKAIILCPTDTALLTDSINSLQAANIPLAYITLFNHPYGVKQDSNNYETGLVVGRLGAQFFNEELANQQANVVVLEYPGFPAPATRADGMEAGFRETVPNAHFVGRYNGFTQDAGYNSIKQLIADGTDFNVILAMFDAGAYGAIKAMQEAGFDSDSVVVVSTNGESYAQELIRQGTFLRGTVTINRAESSQLAVDAIVKMLAGSPVPETLTYAPGEILTREVLLARDGAAATSNSNASSDTGSG